MNYASILKKKSHFCKNFYKIIWSIQKVIVPLQTQMRQWSGSSVWLEYMPVTHGVASSSLVQTAKQEKEV